MKSIADQLPPEIAAQLHPDRRKNEAAYWAVRDQLLHQYQGQWIGFADGKVIASGSSRQISHSLCEIWTARGCRLHGLDIWNAELMIGQVGQPLTDDSIQTVRQLDHDAGLDLCRERQANAADRFRTG